MCASPSLFMDNKNLGFKIITGVLIGLIMTGTASSAYNPMDCSVCMIGSQNPKISPVTPKQQQQTTTITTMAMIQDLVFLGVVSGCV
jgi:hypothetical protein